MEKETPFWSPIVPNEFTLEHPKIREIEGTGYLLRSDYWISDHYISGEIINEYKEAINRWMILGSYKGISLPKFSPVIGIGGEDRKESFMLVVEKIKGPNLQDLVLAPGEVSQALPLFNDFISGLISYSKYIYEKRESYLSDQNLSQYVYGKGHNGKKGIFYVDLERDFRSLPEDGSLDTRFFGSYMLGFYIMLEELEKKVDQPLVQARVDFINFLENIPDDARGISYAKSLIRELSQPRLPNL